MKQPLDQLTKTICDALNGVAKVRKNSIAATSMSCSLYQGMESWSDDLMTGKYGDNFAVISSKSAVTPSFLKEYRSNANQYASFNRTHNIGNIHYRENTTCDPKNLINIIKLTY